MKKLYILMIAIFMGNIVNGQSWQPVGLDEYNQATYGNGGYHNIAIDGNGIPYVVYKFGNYVAVRKFNGSNWVDVGNGGIFCSSYNNYASIAINSANTPYVVFRESYGKATVKKFENNSWINVGNSEFSAGNVTYTSIAIDNTDTLYVVYCDEGYNGRVIVKKFNGSNWVMIGSYISSNPATYTSIAIDNTGIPYVVFSEYANGDKASVKKFDGSSWVNVGSINVSVGKADYTSIAISSTGVPYIIYQDWSNNNKATVRKYNGSAWVDLGSVGISAGSVKYTSIDIDNLGNPYVVYCDSLFNWNSTAKKYNGNAWVNLGNIGLNASDANNTSIALNSSGIPYVIYQDKLLSAVKKYNGNNWEDVGNISFSSGYANYISIAADINNSPYVIYQDYVNGKKATVKKFNGNNWVDLNSAGISSNKVDYTSIVINSSGNPYIVFQDTLNSNAIAIVKKYSGNSWLSLGSVSYSVSTLSFTSIVLDNTDTPYVVYRGGSYPFNAYVSKYNGSAWINVGSSSSSSVSDNGVDFISKIAIDSSGTPYVAYSRNNAFIIRKFNGTNWVDVGNIGNIGNGSFNGNLCNFTVNSSGIPYVVYEDPTINKASVKKFNGSSWVYLGSAGFSQGQVQAPSITTDNSGNPIVTYGDYGKTSVKKFNGNNWEYVGDSSFYVNVNNSPYWNYSAIGGGGRIFTVHQTFGIWVRSYSFCNNPVNGGNIATNQTICIGATPVAFSNIMNPSGYSGILEYKWQNSTIGDTIGFNDIFGATALTYQPIAINTDTWYRRLAKVDCDSLWINAVISNVVKISVDSFPVSSAGIISGTTIVCQNATAVTYTVPLIANATNYIWTLPAGAAGTSITNTITVNYGTSAVSGNITVKGNNSCGDGTSSVLAVTVNPLPTSAGFITGSTNVTEGQQNVQYSVPVIANATVYNWTLPNGATGTSTSNSITVNYGTSAVSGNITVKGSNSCGDGISSSIYVTVNPFVLNCSAQFDLVADTAVLHHYFIVNNASGVPPLHYNWSWGDGTHDTLAFPTHTYSTAGYYNICLSITDSVGCTVSYCDSSYLQKSPNAIITINVVPVGWVGINNLTVGKVNIYPNPAKDNLIIELKENKIIQNTSVSIYNIQGQLLKQFAIKESKTDIDIHKFAKGVYIIKIYNEKENFVSRFVKE